MSAVAATATPGAVRRATLVGGTAILMWSTLALLTALAGPVPPFLLVALSFGLGGLVSLGIIAATGRPVKAAVRQPLPVWLLGIGGLFGYHFLYFLALQTAPAAEANLINYLWPLLIVLFAGLLPGERLGRPQLLGAAAGLAGTLLLITGGKGISVDAQYLPGYLAALACSVTWSGYSVLSRRFGAVPTETVAFFCLATSLLAIPCHLLFEQTVWPQGVWGWSIIAAMGIGPVGLAFFVWDHGVKRGDIQTLGALSYATPLLSTGLLIVAGRAGFTWPVVGACLLIVGGAVVASRGLGK
ncbi:aromatic amino acid exporter YddG [Niveispirillum cyanobacteriorum]|uniref:EamA family transporter n=1 Tax=Niveispirillum cyanobacteriorum TaxID=1612173 RepID=A0A2K9NN05_9PROT|nr:EamA family transporter [Niveispirillum cyanobacteriorum]AUN33725.1 EamA family transporter [Niveispirillum cyanobacteriorum]GGE82210.1 membrane protein [Niveispirillum cyanobacteriorum]